ncbi:MAG: SDR family oxidoreductase [Flavobacterium sp.]|uniref:SDR family oxidoreductase n=1 Tax=Flavobacterium sp. TaxID=239 RepID=UPI0022C54CC6|nr:SDR family oxidoreductase [Flavobacterium sp.]MCZ8196870.1 SDR family oxidoreductase [Flavobacterium sp.]
MGKILVTGVTGSLGKDVVTYLSKRADIANIAVLVRDSSKVQELKAIGIDVRVGDYDNYNSLLDAFKDVEKLYFVSGSDIVKRLSQHTNVVNAAKESRVKHIFYTSFMRKNETQTSPIAFITDAHLKTENLIKESGIKYTILKHAIYADIIPMFAGENLLESGVLYFPAGDEKIGFTLRNDMAELAAVLLTSDGHENKFYDVTNEETITFSEIATIISKISGKVISYVSPTQEEYSKTLLDAGVPNEFIGMFAGFAEAFKQGEFTETNNFIQTIIGRKPVSVEQFLEKVYS